MGHLSPLLHLFIQPFIYISMTTWIFILYSWVIIKYFFAQVVPALAIGSSLYWLLCPSAILWITVFLFGLGFLLLWLFLSIFLLSGTKRCSGLNLCICCTSPRISHSSKEPWFLLVENGIRNQDLGARFIYFLFSLLPFITFFAYYHFLNSIFLLGL